MMSGTMLKELAKQKVKMDAASAKLQTILDFGKNYSDQNKLVNSAGYYKLLSEAAEHFGEQAQKYHDLEAAPSKAGMFAAAAQPASQTPSQSADEAKPETDQTKAAPQNNSGWCVIS